MLRCLTVNVRQPASYFIHAGARRYLSAIVSGSRKSSRKNVLGVPVERLDNTIKPVVLKALGLENGRQCDTNAEKIRQCIVDFRLFPSDTGSPEVQVAVLTERIRYLTAHMKANHKDNNTRRSLVQLVHKRRGMMKYLLRISPERYLDLVRRLGLRETSVFSKDIGVKGAKNKPSPALRRN